MKTRFPALLLAIAAAAPALAQDFPPDPFLDDIDKGLVGREITSHGITVGRTGPTTWHLDADAGFKAWVDLAAQNDWTQSYELKAYDLEVGLFGTCIATNSGSWVVPRGSTMTWSSHIDLTISGIDPGHEYSSKAWLQMNENGGPGVLPDDPPNGYSYRQTQASN